MENVVKMKWKTCDNRVYDALGLSVLEKQIIEESSSILLNTSNLKDGLYWVKVHVAGKQVFADKLIIIH